MGGAKEGAGRQVWNVVRQKRGVARRDRNVARQRGGVCQTWEVGPDTMEKSAKRGFVEAGQDGRISEQEGCQR